MSGVDEPFIRAPTRPVPPSIPAPPEQPRRILDLSSSPPPVVAATPRRRTVRPDLTGYWESPRSPGNRNQASPFLAQVNQAGGVVVLWFTRPPPGVEGVDPLRLPDVQAGGAMKEWVYGVASAVVRDLDGSDRLAAGGDLSWLAAVRPPGPDATLDLFNVLDPSHLYAPPDGLEVMSGNGRIEGDGSTLTIGFGQTDGGRAAQVMLRKLRPGSRLPRAVLDTVPAPLHTALLIDSVRPIPSRLERQMLSLFAPEWADGEPRMAALLRRWKATPEAKLARDAPRTAIGRELAFGLDEPWRTALLDKMTVAARTNLLPLGGRTKTYADWLTEVLAEEEAATRAQRRAESQEVLDAIRPLRTGSADTFAYTLKFSELGASGSFLGQKGTSRGLSAGAFGVLVGISKEAITLARDNQGNVEYDDPGRAVVVPTSRRPVPWGGATDPVVGVFGRVETGLTYKDAKKQDPTAPVADKKWHEHVGSGDLGSVEFRSSLDITSTTAFDQALFVVSSVVLGKVKFGNWVKAQLTDSALWEMRLATGQRLSAIVDGDPFKGPKISSFLNATKKSWWKDWVPTEVGVTGFRLSVGYGVLFTPTSWAATKRRRTPPGPSTRKVEAPLTAELRSFFEYDSFRLEDPKWPEVRAMPRRLRLEERLAEVRRVLALGGSPLVLVGMTSPEGEAEANHILSLNRIHAVEQAIKDALGPIDARGKPHHEALGEKPSTAARLWSPDRSPVGGRQRRVVGVDRAR
jgi:hypothetical protein